VTEYSFVDESGITRLRGTIAPPPGGASPSIRVLGPFPIAFDSPGISTGGYEFYTPAAGDLLLDAWFSIDTAWDGTTPLADIGSPLYTAGVYLHTTGAPVDMTQVDYKYQTTDWYFPINATLAQLVAAVTAQELLQVPFIPAGGANQQPLVALSPDSVQIYPGLPIRSSNGDALTVWVTQNGHSNGSDPVAAHGAGNIYLVVATPSLP
jgi:hypothetical protein